MSPHTGSSSTAGSCIGSSSPVIHLGELDPATGKMTRHKMPLTGAGAHSSWVDSRGQIWYTYFASSGHIGRFDTKSKEFTEWEPIKGFSGYGIVVDRQDRVWAVGLHTHATLMYNQETQQWKTYQMSQPARRPAIDGNGKIWAAHFYGNIITKIDPVTDEVTEYELPLKDGNPYDIWPDGDDNLWIENMSLQLAGQVRPDDEPVHVFPVSRAEGPHAKDRFGPWRDNLVFHAWEPVGSRNRRVEARWQRGDGRIVCAIAFGASVSPSA